MGGDEFVDGHSIRFWKIETGFICTRVLLSQVNFRLPTSAQIQKHLAKNNTRNTSEIIALVSI
jgi:hypothetical protein